jgi:hypothetical protein
MTSYSGVPSCTRQQVKALLGQGCMSQILQATDAATEISPSPFWPGPLWQGVLEQGALVGRVKQR